MFRAECALTALRPTRLRSDRPEAAAARGAGPASRARRRRAQQLIVPGLTLPIRTLRAIGIRVGTLPPYKNAAERHAETHSRDASWVAGQLGGRIMIRFKVSGHKAELTADEVQHRLRGIRPEPVRQYSVQVGSRVYPVKQAFEAATGIPRSAFTTQAARRHLAALGFEVVPDRVGLLTPQGAQASAEAAGQSASIDDWHTEAKVQAIVVAHLVREGWQIVSEADTARRQRGIDIVAGREHEELAVEVKGFPGRGFADPRRAGEQKRARPPYRPRAGMAGQY